MTTTITLNEDALIRQLKDVDRRLTRATDPYQTILSERGVALLQEYRDGLNEQLKASPKKKATVSEPDHQLALCMRPELQYAKSPVLTGRPHARKSGNERNGHPGRTRGRA
jgi:hypothetical protein